jgi:hypothetical protein
MDQASTPLRAFLELTCDVVTAVEDNDAFFCSMDKTDQTHNIR